MADGSTIMEGKTMNDNTEEMITREVVIIGPVILQGGKKGVETVVLAPDGKLSDKSFYLSRADFKGEPGTVYSVPMNAGLTRMRTSQRKFLRVWEDDNLPFWRAKADAQLAREREQSMASKGQTEALAKSLKCMEPIKIAYAGGDRWTKTVIEALVLQYLRAPL